LNAALVDDYDLTAALKGALDQALKTPDAVSAATVSKLVSSDLVYQAVERINTVRTYLGVQDSWSEETALLIPEGKLKSLNATLMDYDNVSLQTMQNAVPVDTVSTVDTVPVNAVPVDTMSSHLVYEAVQRINTAQKRAKDNIIFNIMIVPGILVVIDIFLWIPHMPH